MYVFQKRDLLLTFIAFTIAYLLRMLHDPDPPLAANLAFDAIQRSMPAMEASGFDMELVSSLEGDDSFFRQKTLSTPYWN